MEDRDKQKFIVDCETNGLLRDANKVWSLGWCDTKTGLVCSTTFEDQMKDFLTQEDIIIIGHNFCTYDKPILESILGITIKAKIIDTLAISWVISPERNKHGLAEYGEEFGVPKVKVDDWLNLDSKLAIERVEQDVRINYKLWKNQAQYLNNLYEGNHEQIYKFLFYLSFKLSCIEEQEKEGLKLDIEKCKENLSILEQLKEEKIIKLKESMPKKGIKSTKFYPKKFHKEDGSISAIGQKWLLFLKEQGLPNTHKEEVEYISSYEEPNPNSHDQIKNWLYSIGWVPENIKHIRDKEKGGEVRKVPQIKSKTEEDEICESIKKLFEKEPNLEVLDSLFVISHRITIFKGFLECLVEGKIYPTIAGLTNTFRFKHSKPCVNLPTEGKKYGKEVRECLIKRDENSILCGYDLSNIEDNTKRHYIYPLDPEYVKSQMTKGFDSHLDVAQIAGMLTKEQVENHKLGTEDHSTVRRLAKIVNFSCVYGVAKDTLSKSLNSTPKEAQKFIDAYWERNWAVKKVAESFKVKTIGSQKWVYNPISQFWYTLRAEKDRFATINSSSAVYCYDRWAYYIRQQGVKIAYQCHDEGLSNVYLDYKDVTKEKILNAIQSVNDELKLNVQIGCSIKFGETYYDCH